MSCISDNLDVIIYACAYALLFWVGGQVDP